MKIISLGSVLFDDIVEQDLYIEEEHKWLPIGQTIKHSLAGSIAITENVRSGKPLTIISKEDRGWITKATVLELKALASLILTSHTLSIINDSNQAESRVVQFKRDSTALDLSPLDSGHNYYVGSINLIQL